VNGEWQTLLATDLGTGTPVLLVHGQPGSAGDWNPVVEVLARDRDRLRVLVVDRPGYGAATVPPRSMGDNAELLADLLEDRGAAPAVVVGHSYGGGIALLMASRRPEVVAGLVLVSAVGPAGSVNGFDHVLALPALGDMLSAAGLFTVGRLLPKMRALSRRWGGPLAQRLQVTLPDDRYGAALSGSGLRMWRAFLAEQRSLVAEIGDVSSAIARVSVPTAVVTGTWDVVVPPALAASLAAQVHGAELVTVAQVGHFSARDAPRAVAGAVERTVERAGRGGP
jgi:pimeloyl-ACP methyl ester carboxylesterase